MPEFDFSEISRKWEKEFSRVNVKLGRSGLLSETKISKDATDEQKKDFLRMQLEIVDDLDNLVDTRDALVCEVLVSVPREWLVSRAPDGLDWKNPESLDWLRVGKLEEIVHAIFEERSAKN